jgi:tripartite-type tricarboxylate transporter receptor subunit TctC
MLLSHVNNRLHRIRCSLPYFSGTFVVLLALIGTTAVAQTYPNRPIKLIVPYSSGTGMDMIARIVGPKLAQRLGQPVVVENRLGASGNIGSSAVATSAPDGYTLMVNAQAMLIAARLYRSMPFDVLTDFAPISLTAWGTQLLVTHAKSGISNVGELVAMAKANPGKLTYSTSGTGSSFHIATETFNGVTGIQMLHVPYKGNAAALTDLIGGRVTVTVSAVHVVLPHVKAGTIVPLAVISPRRHVKMPDVPTMAEAGAVGVDNEFWHAMWAPKGTPEAIITRIGTELHAILVLPDVKDAFENVGLTPTTSTPDELLALTRRDLARLEQVIRKHNISLE